MFSLISGWNNGWVNPPGVDDLRRHYAHYDVNVISFIFDMSLDIINSRLQLFYPGSIELELKLELELELELEKNLFDKKYINVSTGYYKHTENDTHCRETLTLVQDVPLSREPPGKYK